MEGCTFCKIVKGEIPSVKIWEDEDHIAILDIDPSTRGHSLIIPKAHHETIFDISKPEFDKAMNAAKKVAEILKEKLKAGGMNLLISSGEAAQQEVPHLHVHLIPRYEGESFKIKLENKTENKNLEEVAKLLKQ